MRSPMTGAAAACYNPWRLQRRGHGLVEASFHTHHDEGLARMSQLIDKLEQAASGASQPLGFGTARREQSEDLPTETWDLLLRVNQSSVFFCSRAASRPMLANSHGAIVNMAFRCSLP